MQAPTQDRRPRPAHCLSMANLEAQLKSVFNKLARERVLPLSLPLPLPCLCLCRLYRFPFVARKRLKYFECACVCVCFNKRHAGSFLNFVHLLTSSPIFKFHTTLYFKNLPLVFSPMLQVCTSGLHFIQTYNQI